MAVTQHVFPLRLDGATQEVAAVASWNGATSLIDITTASGTYDLTVPDAEKAGTLLTIKRSASGSNAVSVKNAGGAVLVSLDSATDTSCLIWTGSAWEILSNATASGDLAADNVSLSGALTVAGAATLNGNVAVGDATTDTVGFYGVTAVAQQAAAAQAAVTAETNLPTAGTGAGSAYTQAEVTAAIENIHDLIALTNEIRQCLVDLGLIKGAA